MQKDEVVFRKKKKPICNYLCLSSICSWSVLFLKHVFSPIRFIIKQKKVKTKLCSVIHTQRKSQKVLRHIKASFFFNQVVCPSNRTAGRWSSVRRESSAVGHSCDVSSEVYWQGGESSRASFIFREGTAGFYYFRQTTQILLADSWFVFLICSPVASFMFFVLK